MLFFSKNLLISFSKNLKQNTKTNSIEGLIFLKNINPPTEMIKDHNNNGEYKDVDSSEKKIARVQFYLDPDLKIKLKSAALKERITFSKFLAALLYEALIKRENRDKFKNKSMEIDRNKKQLTNEEFEQLKKDLIQVFILVKRNPEVSLFFKDMIANFKENLTKQETELEEFKNKDKADEKSF